MRGKWRLFRQDAGRVAGPPALVYILLFALCVALGNWSSARYGAVLLWPANGLLLAALLQLHRRRAIAVLASCFAINLIGNYLRADPPHLVVVNAVLNLGEVMLAGLIARRFCGAALDLRRPVRLVRFVLLAAFPAVALSALIGVSAIPTPLPMFWISLQTYFAVETLGILIVTPTFLLMARTHRFRTPDEAPNWEKAALIAALALVTTAVFAQSAAPVSFLVFLPLMLIAFRLPPAWSAFGIILIAVIAGSATLNGYGPIALTTLGPSAAPADVSLPALRALPVFHLFMSVLLAVALPASTVLTQRRLLEAKLKARSEAAERACARAEHAAEAKSRFLSMMSHEMRTPLNGVSGFAEILAAHPGLDRSALLKVEQIRRSSENLLVLVDDILDFSCGEMKIVPAPFSPALIARKALGNAVDEAEAKALTLSFIDGLEPGACFDGDARRVRQILHHLLSNAIKFTQAGEVEVSLLPRGDGFELRVADTGPGLAAGVSATMFHPFVQADASISRGHEGAGMGLALSRRIVDAMGGEIGAANRAGGGAVFWVRLPLARAASATVEPVPAERVEEPEEIEGADARALRVLVVDDHPVNREVACVMLSAAGCETAIARDGVEAVEAARDGGFDLILMDVRMPRMDGLQATRSIRGLHGAAGATPIVAMTADCMPDDVARCLAAGMDAHLAKPISQATLLGTLSRVLDNANTGDRAAARPAG